MDERQLQWRRERITATDVADAVTGSYGGLYGAVARKQGRVVTEQNDAMKRGLRWEQVIADAVHILTGLYVVGEQFQVSNANDDRWGATIDGLLAPAPEVHIDDCVGVLEIKTVGLGVIPNLERWRAQVQWQLLCTGMPMGIIAEARIDDSEDRCMGLRFHDVEADQFIQADLIEAAEDMWAHMENGTLPEPDDASALPVVKAVYAVAEHGEAANIDHLAEDVEAYGRLKSASKSMEDELARLEARIRDAMGESVKGSVDGWKVSLSMPARKLTAEREAELLETHPEYGVTVLDRKRVKDENPALYESFQTTTGARRLTVTAPKET